jgi:hypothetical protein
MKEYILIIILQLIGVGFHVMQKIGTLGDKFPEKNPSEVWGIFFQEDWNTLIVSLLVLSLNITAHYIVTIYSTVQVTVPYYDLYSFGAALVLGYAGQRVIYKYLGTAEKLLNKKVDNQLQ